MSKKSQQNEKYLAFFGSTEGMEILKDFKKKLDVRSFTPGDIHMTSYMEGRRSVYLDLMHTIRSAENFNPDMEKDL